MTKVEHSQSDPLSDSVADENKTEVSLEGRNRHFLTIHDVTFHIYLSIFANHFFLISFIYSVFV